MQKIGYYRKSGELFLQNKSLKKLADDYGTPTFIYDSNLIKNCSQDDENKVGFQQSIFEDYREKPVFEDILDKSQ